MDHQFEEKLNALDLEPILFVLVRAEDGPKWTLRQSIIAEKWYKRFHALIHKYPSQTIVPTKVIDTIWHKHILDTRKYLNDCVNLHGEIVHHFPYLGVRNPDDMINLNRLYMETIGLFIEMFGESPEDIEPIFGHAPQGGVVICGHAPQGGAVICGHAPQEGTAIFAGRIASKGRPRLSLTAGSH